MTVMNNFIYQTLRYTLTCMGILSLCLSLSGCEKDDLDDESVIVMTPVSKEEKELKEWIEEHFVRPYNINVVYKWNKNHTQEGSYTYPPEISKVKSVLETIKTLWIDIYTLEDMGGEHFFKEKAPIHIYLYGGRHLDGNGVELIGNSDATTKEMFLYNVNEFDPNNEAEVYALMRCVHHQYLKLLMETLPYDRNQFLKISRNRYDASTKFIADIKKGNAYGAGLFKPSPYAHRRGFFTFHSFLSLENDFAEIGSVMLTHTPKEIDLALKEAATPLWDANPEQQDKNNEEARQAHKELSEKLEFVKKYFKETVKISLNNLQLVSVKALKQYSKK